jgi:hypothetical protein
LKAAPVKKPPPTDFLLSELTPEKKMFPEKLFFSGRNRIKLIQYVIKYKLSF